MVSNFLITIATIAFLLLIVATMLTAVDWDIDRTMHELEAALERLAWWRGAAAETSPPSTPPPAPSLVSRIRSWARFRAL